MTESKSAEMVRFEQSQTALRTLHGLVVTLSVVPELIDPTLLPALKRMARAVVEAIDALESMEATQR